MESWKWILVSKPSWLACKNAFFRFGPIIGLKSLRPIKKGEELFAHYGYQEGPSWYQKLRVEFLEQQKLNESLGKEELEKNSENNDDSVWWVTT